MEKKLVKSSSEHKKYHHQSPAPTTPGSDLDCGQHRRHHAGAPANGTRLMKTTM